MDMEDEMDVEKDDEEKDEEKGAMEEKTNDEELDSNSRSSGGEPATLTTRPRSSKQMCRSVE